MFGDKLKYLRTTHGYSMDKLAEIYNEKFDGKLNKSTISRYENSLQEPIFTTVKNFAKLFDVSTDFLTDIDSDIGRADTLSYRKLLKSKGWSDKDIDALFNPIQAPFSAQEIPEKLVLMGYRYLDETDKDIIWKNIREMLSNEKYKDTDFTL